MLVLLTLFVLFIVVFFLVYYKKPYNQTTKQVVFPKLISTVYKQEYNLDINTKDWDLHKIRLNKFGKSQYKVLTFFISSKDRIYYLSEKGIKIYC